VLKEVGEDLDDNGTRSGIGGWDFLEDKRTVFRLLKEGLHVWGDRSGGHVGIWVIVNFLMIERFG
jgi:hypothetical protein